MLSDVVVVMIYIAITGLAALPFYWDIIKGLFHDISYDSRIFAVQITAIIALLSLLVSIRRK